MSAARRVPRATRLLRLKIVLAIYALAVALMPLAHHDVACHLKSSTHCTTCVVGASAEASADAGSLARFWLTDMGAATPAAHVEPDSPSLCIASGRAPPVTS
jgi:hypothetical protein